MTPPPQDAPDAESGLDDGTEQTAVSSRRQRRRPAVEAAVAEDPQDSTIVIQRGVRDDDTVRVVRAPRAAPVVPPASAALPPAPGSPRTASAPVRGRVAHAPAVGPATYARRTPPPPALDRDAPAPPAAAVSGIPPQSFAEGPRVDREVRATARRRAALLGGGIVLAVALAAIALVALLGGVFG